MSQKRDPRARRWTAEQRAEAVEVLTELAGDSRSAERVLLSRHGRAGTPSDRQLRRWWTSAVQAAPTAAPVAAAAALSRDVDQAPNPSALDLLSRAARLLEHAERSPSLAPRDRASIATSLASVASRLADMEPRGDREIRVKVEGIVLSREEAESFLRWISDERRRAAQSPGEIADELDGLLRELLEPRVGAPAGAPPGGE